MNKPLFCLAMAVTLLVGCRPEENPGQLEAVNQSLERVNDVIKEENKLVMEEMLGKQKDPATAGMAGVWLPRANRIHQYTDSISIFVQNIKNEVIAQSDSFKREYVTVVKQLYDVNGLGSQLVDKLAAFKDSIPALIFAQDVNDTLTPYKRNLLESIPLLPGYHYSLTTDGKTKYRKKWLDESFGRSSSLMALIMLNKIENDVLATEKLLLEYCNNQSSGCHILIYDEFESIAVLSSSYVKKGQTIKVRAGVGAFSIASNPTITIDGNVVRLNGRAMAIYDFTANGSPGTHTVLVGFEYIRPDGIKTIKTQALEYIIADEK